MQATYSKILLTLLCIISTATFALAQKGRFNPEMRKEVQAYNQQNIIPVLREHRLKLDSDITATDKTEIDRLRTERKTVQEKRKALREKYKGKKGEGKAQLTDAQKAEIKHIREQQKQLHQATAAIALKYQPQLERIKESIADERTTWETDLKAIAAKYNPEQADKAFDDKKRSRHSAKLAVYKRLTVPANFILWDAGQDQDTFTVQNKSTVYPNPTYSTNTIDYTIAKEGSVKITLLDATGNVLRTLLNEPKAKGHYTLDVNLNNLPNTTYYYKIETASGTETKRILKR